MCLMTRLSVNTEIANTLLSIQRASLGLEAAEATEASPPLHEVAFDELEPEPEHEHERQHAADLAHSNPPANLDRSRTPALHWYEDLEQLATFYSGLLSPSSPPPAAASNPAAAAPAASIRPVGAVAAANVTPPATMSEASPQQAIKMEEEDLMIDMTANDNEDGDEEEEEDDDEEEEEEAEQEYDDDDALVGESTANTPRRPAPSSSIRPVPDGSSAQQTLRQRRHGRIMGTGRGIALPSDEARPDGEVPAFFQNNGLIMRNDSGGQVPTNNATLPTEKSFTIQVGPETFRLSGASINSDAPSYFSKFFESELAKREANNVPSSEPVRTLYIDRDPVTFRDIALHLQGYHVQPRDSTHYVRLFADAQFYVLPRLVKHLWESDVFIRIGEDEFCVPRDLFTLEPGNTPNYFTLGFSLLFSTPGNPFPGLDVSGLLRPPAIKAASASGRSGRIFADILDLLRGYEVHIRDESHRAALLRDCRYYHLRGLEQKIIPHALSWNEARKTSEIILRLEDVRQSGISVDRFAVTPDDHTRHTPGGGVIQAVRYARPFIDDGESPHELIVETGADSATVRPGNGFVVEFHNESRQRIMSLFKVVKAKIEANMRELLMLTGGGAGASNGSNDAAPQQDVQPRVFIINEDGKAIARIESDAVVTVDGEEGWLVHPASTSAEPAAEHVEGADEDEAVGGAVGADGPADEGATPDRARGTKRRRLNGRVGEPAPEPCREWTVMRSQWRIRCQSWQGASPSTKNVAIHLYAISLDVVTGQKGRNRSRGFIMS